MSLAVVPQDGATLGGHRGLRRGLIYAVLLASAVGITEAVLRMGTTIHRDGVSSRSASVPLASGANVSVGRLLLAVAVVLVATQLSGLLFRHFHQPHVVGEIVAGIGLGPSLLGGLFPSVRAFVFPPSILVDLNVLAQIGLVIFMFLIGLEVDRWRLRSQAHATVVISHVSIIVPFLLGLATALLLFPKFGGAGGFTGFALFLGASMSVTAFPVLARILSESKLSGTALGTTALACAAVDDITAWCLLAVVVSVTRAGSARAAIPTIALSVAFVVLMFCVVKPILERLLRNWDSERRLGGAPLAAIFAGILLSAMATDLIGIQPIFGAFLFGLIMPFRSDLVAQLRAKLEDMTVLLLLPMFFAYTGMRTQIGLLGTSPRLWLYCLLILVVAVAGKWGSSTVAGRVLGLDWDEAITLGALMNTRGLTELIILNVGLSIGAIPPVLFTMLVVMALATTFMAAPVAQRMGRRLASVR